MESLSVLRIPALLAAVQPEVPYHPNQEGGMNLSNRRTHSLAAALTLTVVTLASAPAVHAQSSSGSPATALARKGAPGTSWYEGAAATLGEKVRTYVILDEKAGKRPIEIGIAIDARLLEGALPAGESQRLTLELSKQVPEPYRFALFDWNPHGHIPPGVYDTPHFDFHYYLTPLAEVEAIVPSDPHFAARANNLPTGDHVPQFYTAFAPPGQDYASMAEPKMGVHWTDVRAPELQQLLNKPADYRPFTYTFIYGSWDGQITFLEPMITRAFLRTRPDMVVSIPQPKRYPQPGWYPNAYRISYDAEAKEYRVALVDFTRRQ
jgi:hypothetical protein